MAGKIICLLAGIGCFTGGMLLALYIFPYNLPLCFILCFIGGIAIGYSFMDLISTNHEH